MVNRTLTQLKHPDHARAQALLATLSDAEVESQEIVIDTLQAAGLNSYARLIAGMSLASFQDYVVNELADDSDPQTQIEGM